MLSRRKTGLFHLGKFCILVLLLLFISSTGHTQTKYPYWSVAVTGGAILPVGNFSDAFDASGCVGADVVYHVDPYWSAYGNVTYISLREKISLLSDASYIEVTGGPRYYLTRQKVMAFGETGIGLYSYRVGSTTTTTGTVTIVKEGFTDNYLGLNIGAGVEVPVMKTITVVGKIKYHAIFTAGATTNYAGFYGGINVNFP